MKSRRNLRFAAVALLLAALAMSGDYYSEQSAEFTKTQGVIPFGPRVPDTAAVPDLAAPPTHTAPPTLAALPAATSPPNTTKPEPPASTSSLDKILTLAPPAAGPVGAVPPPQFTECPDAVAALGFCSSGSNNEGQ
jgi:hypothetical protein